MKPIEIITGLPDWKWMKNSAEELAITGEELITESDIVYRVGDVVAVGFIYHSFTSPPWMWFVLAENVGIKDLIDFRRLAELIPEGTLTGVRANFAVGLRFAKLYGFEETGEQADYHGRPYKLMRKK